MLVMGLSWQVRQVLDFCCGQMMLNQNHLSVAGPFLDAGIGGQQS